MPEPKRFRKKAIEVEAVQWTGENREEVTAFLRDGETLSEDGAGIWRGDELAAFLPETPAYVIRNEGGGLRAERANLFEATYEPAPASLQKDGGEGRSCVSCNGSGHDWEPGPTGEAISKGPCCECGGLGVEYKRGELAEDIIERLEPLETEAKETLDRLKAKRAEKGVPRSTPALPAELVAYTEKRIWRDAICAVADADYQRFVLAASTHPASPSEEGLTSGDITAAEARDRLQEQADEYRREAEEARRRNERGGAEKLNRAAHIAEGLKWIAFGVPATSDQEAGEVEG